ncbi:PAS domain-containing protein [Desulfocurvus vexinensis]|uniref:PAS domain-containing protein n=1 Tax=Desulfocurvus vexinensis TaxID=399548 RepID=UPI0004AEC301|nr:PAS domain-containing protein [Desulfocurvus vexinensis]
MEQGRRWDTFLVEEHELIERAMAVLRANLERVHTLGHDPVQTRRALDFLLEFGDRIHNAKEEEYLFPLLEQRGIPVQGGPLGVMLAEHEAERDLLGRMVRQVGGLPSAPAVERERFVDEGIEYLRIRAEHIWKENDVLYPMGRKVMQERDGVGLLAAFEHLDQQTYGPGARENYARMVAEIEDAGARRSLAARLAPAQIHAILETLPVEVTFVDADDTVAYFNRLDRPKIFPRTRSVIGRKVEKCHPEGSVHVVREIVQSFRDGTRDKAEFWIDFMGRKVHIRYFPVRGDDGAYLGVLEVTQDVTDIMALTGQKRLLD